MCSATSGSRSADLASPFLFVYPLRVSRFPCHLAGGGSFRRVTHPGVTQPPKTGSLCVATAGGEAKRSEHTADTLSVSIGHAVAASFISKDKKKCWLTQQMQWKSECYFVIESLTTKSPGETKHCLGMTSNA